MEHHMDHRIHKISLSIGKKTNRSPLRDNKSQVCLRTTGFPKDRVSEATKQPAETDMAIVSKAG